MSIEGSATGTTRPLLRAGDVLAGRYRLEDAVAGPLESEQGSALWRAVDETLARPVAVKVLPAGGREGAAAAEPFLEAAGLASGLAHPALARVYDAALEQRRVGNRRADVAYVVSEWVDGLPLSELLARPEGLALSPGDAVRLAVQACGAVAAAHDSGIGHGRLHLGNLHVRADGTLVVTDTAVGAAVDGTDTTLPTDDPVLRRTLVAEDTRDLAAVTYALLTGRWPSDATPQPAVGVPSAPGRDKGGDRVSYSPRQVRAGVPRELDVAVGRALATPGPGSTGAADPRALATALEAAGRTLLTPVVEPVTEQRRAPRWWRRLLPWVAAVAFIGVFSAGTYAVGRAVGELPGSDDADLEALVEPTPSAGAGGGRPVRIPLDAAGVTVKDFDPQGDGAERPAEVGNAFDGDVSTTWLTSRYRSASFGGLKSGVGLLVDLGAPSALTRVDVALTTGGSDVEVWVGDREPADVTDLTRVGRSQDARGVTRIGVPAGTRGRFVLVWITTLPEDAGGFREGIDEMVLVR